MDETLNLEVVLEITGELRPLLDGPRSNRTLIHELLRRWRYRSRVERSRLDEIET